MITKDVVVVGSGGAGMTAAITAAKAGLNVLLVEKTEYFGGTTAWSGGGIWVPANELAREAGIADSPEAATSYVKALVGETLREDLLDAFVENAPKMADFLQKETTAQFELMRGFPDWKQDLEGAAVDGRLLGPVTYDGRQLGEYFNLLRPALVEFNAPWGMMFGFSDLAHMAQMKSSLKSFTHMTKMVGRYMLDRTTYSRGTRLTMGNALAARLLKSTIDAGVEAWTNTPVVELTHEGDRISGVVVERNGVRTEIAAKRGVVLATGGFSADPEFRAKYFPFPEHHVSLAAEGGTADGLRMAMAEGGVMEQENHSNAGWVVISVAETKDGKLRKFPHLFLDRGKPGCIAVNKDGKRFGNEAAIDVVKSMHASGSVPAFLICDHPFIKKYGLGLVKPGGLGLNKLIKSGYVKTAPTLSDLADVLGVDRGGLVSQVARSNKQAETGVDDDFGRGASAADHGMGDRTHQPNPNLGPIETAPFYAVKIVPGDSTTTLGLRVDPQARVMKQDGDIIPGLYAVGVDSNSLWRGSAPSNGANNTLSLTFGYIAGKSLAGNAPVEG